MFHSLSKSQHKALQKFACGPYQNESLGLLIHDPNAIPKGRALLLATMRDAPQAMGRIMASSKTSRSAWVLNLVLLVGASLVSLLGGEALIRYCCPQKLAFNISQWDPHVGFSNIPNIEGYSETQDYQMHVKINSRGLRDREYDYVKPPHTVRIGIFGDSFTFGEGVQDNESYPKKLEELLRRDPRIVQAGINVDVINFGLGKTGTSHQLALYQKEGAKYQLDVVIVGFLAGNDFDDNWGGVFFLQNNTLVHNPTAYSSIRKTQSVVISIPLYKWAAMHSHLINLLRKAATIIDDKIRTQNTSTRNAMVKSEADIESGKYLLALRLFEEFQREASQHNSRFLVVNLPGKLQAGVAGYDGGTLVPPYISNCALLLSSLKERGIALIDLVPVFVTLPAIEKHYFANDGHMTVLGHQAIANHVYARLIPEIMEYVQVVSPNSNEVSSLTARIFSSSPPTDRIVPRIAQHSSRAVK